MDGAVRRFKALQEVEPTRCPSRRRRRRVRGGADGDGHGLCTCGGAWRGLQPVRTSLAPHPHLARTLVCNLVCISPASQVGEAFALSFELRRFVRMHRPQPAAAITAPAPTITAATANAPAATDTSSAAASAANPPPDPSSEGWHICCDLDGVLADFDAGVATACATVTAGSTSSCIASSPTTSFPWTNTITTRTTAILSTPTDPALSFRCAAAGMKASAPATLAPPQLWRLVAKQPHFFASLPWMADGRLLWAALSGGAAGKSGAESGGDGSGDDGSGDDEGGDDDHGEDGDGAVDEETLAGAFSFTFSSKKWKNPNPNEKEHT